VKSDGDARKLLSHRADSQLQHLDALEKQLEALRACAVSPFADCDMVHMARFVIIDELPLQLGDTRREFLSRNYLLFVAELSGQRDDFLDALYEHSAPLVSSIWGHCAGFPHRLHGAVYFRRYMQRHEIETLIPFAAVPNVPVGQIYDAIEAQSKLAQFIEEHPPWLTSDQKLFDDWRTTFGTRKSY